MRIKNITSVHEQGSGKCNEDALLIDEEKELFGVLDGATGVIPFFDAEGNSGGKIAAELVKKVFSQLSENMSLVQLAEQANIALQKENEKHNITMQEAEKLFCASGVIVRLRDGVMEYVQVGDSLLTLLFQDGSYKLLTQDTQVGLDAQILAAMIDGMKKGLRTNTAIRQYALPKMREMRILEHKKFGIFGSPDIHQRLQIGEQSLKNVKGILLLTDGLFVHTQNYKKYYDFDLTMAVMKREGLQSLLHFVRKREKEDPECLKYIRFKPHDDATGIFIELEP